MDEEDMTQEEKKELVPVEPAHEGYTVQTRNYAAMVLMVFGIVIVLPIAFTLLFAFSVVMLAFFIGFGIGGITMVAGGVVLIGNGVTNTAVGLGIPFVLSGAGLIVAAIGILFIVFAVNCAFRAIPAMYHACVTLVRGLPGRRNAA